MYSSNQKQYQIGRPNVQYNPLVDGREAMIASTRSLRSHLQRPTDNTEFRTHLQALQDMPQVSYTSSNVPLAAQGGVQEDMKNRGFQYKNQTLNPPNTVTGLRGQEIALEGNMRTSSFDNETRMSSFAFGDRSLNDIGLNEVGQGYSLGKASSLSARDLLGTKFSTHRKPVSGMLDDAMQTERNCLDPVYANKRRMAPGFIIQGIDTRQTDVEPRKVVY